MEKDKPSSCGINQEFFDPGVFPHFFMKSLQWKLVFLILRPMVTQPGRSSSGPPNIYRRRRPSEKFSMRVAKSADLDTQSDITITSVLILQWIMWPSNVLRKVSF